MHLHVNGSAGDRLVNPVDRHGGHNKRRPGAYWLVGGAAIFIMKISEFYGVSENRVCFFDQAQRAYG
jgi:hypothetical protein